MAKLYKAGQLIAIQMLRDVYPKARQMGEDGVLALSLERVPEAIRRQFLDNYFGYWEERVPVNQNEQIHLPHPADERMTIDGIVAHTTKALQPYEPRTDYTERGGTSSETWARHPLIQDPDVGYDGIVGYDVIKG